MEYLLRNLLSSRLLRMSFLLKNLLKRSFQNMKNAMLMHLRKMVLNKMLIQFLVANPLILVLQMKCKLRKSSATSTF